MELDAASKVYDWKYIIDVFQHFHAIILAAFGRFMLSPR